MLEPKFGNVPIAVAQFVGRIVGVDDRRTIDFVSPNRSQEADLLFAATPADGRFTLKAAVRSIQSAMSGYVTAERPHPTVPT